MHAPRFSLPALGAAAFVMCTSAGAVPAAGPACQPATPGGPPMVTAACVDPQFDRPDIDRREQVAAPFPHLRVAGHLAGTAVKFNFYFPIEQQWQGWFFQSVYPVASAEADAATL